MDLFAGVESATSTGRGGSRRPSRGRANRVLPGPYVEIGSERSGSGRSRHVPCVITEEGNLPPGAEVPTIHHSGTNAGFEAFDSALLGLGGLVVILHAVSSRKRLQTVFTLLAGVGAVVFRALHLSGSSLAGFTATFVPALGWHLTVLGGVLLTVAGRTSIAVGDSGARNDDGADRLIPVRGDRASRDCGPPNVREPVRSGRIVFAGERGRGRHLEVDVR